MAGPPRLTPGAGGPVGMVVMKFSELAIGQRFETEGYPWRVFRKVRAEGRAQLPDAYNAVDTRSAGPLSYFCFAARDKVQAARLEW